MWLHGPNFYVRLIHQCDLHVYENGKNRMKGLCDLYTGATYDPENTLDNMNLNSIVHFPP